MLPSQGLFRSIPCPFFLAGLCERPHCSFRHCRSGRFLAWLDVITGVNKDEWAKAWYMHYLGGSTDIRIDRKIEAEALEDNPSQEDIPGSPSPTKNEGIQKITSNNNAASSDGSSGPVINKESLINNEKSDSEINSNTKEQPIKRLKSTHSSDVTSPLELNRKRYSRDSDSEEVPKRRRLSTDSEEMGQIVGRFRKNSAEKDEPELSKKDRQRKEAEELDKLVEEIEKSGKSPKHKKYKKHFKRKRKDSGDSNTSGDSNSTNQPEEKSKDDKLKESKPTEEKARDEKSKESKSKEEKAKDEKSKESKPREEKPKDCKQNSEKPKEKKLKDDHRKRTEEKKDREVKDSRSHSKHGDHKRKKDSPSDSPKNSKRHRKSSSCHESDESAKRTERSSHSIKNKDARKEDRKSTEDKLHETEMAALKSVQNNVDIANRFSVLADASADESAYNSDIFDESMEFNYPGGSDSEDDPEMVARECLELFENYKPPADQSADQGSAFQPSDKKEEDPDEGFCVVGKKRVAHASAVMKTPSAPPPRMPPATSKNLHDTVFKRLEDQNKKGAHFSNGSAPSSGPPRPTGKTRIAHVPNAGLLAHKPAAHHSCNTSTSASSSSNNSSTHSTSSLAKPGQPGSLTYSQTAAKGVKREAHKPSAIVTSRQGPVIFRDAINKTTKIPHVTRQQIVDKMYPEYCRVLGDHQLAFEATVQRENELLGKCTSKQVYLSSGISIISGLRKANKQETDQNALNNRLVSHAHILSGSLEAKNCSVRTSKKDDSMPRGNVLYMALRKYIMTERQLEENGYPRPHPSGEPGRAAARPRPGEENSMTLRRRICDRCRKRYETTEDGNHTVSEVCNYHWGRKYNVKAKGGRGTRETNYSCCGSEDDNMGCATAVCHVSKCPIPISSQKGFVEAVLEEGQEDHMGNDPWDIIGIDCEMVYTTHGNELARVTIVGADLKVLYDEIVKPTHRVLDCNTRFSGITFEDMDKAKRNITEIQAIILTHLRPNTIIIGHSLESDLLALRLKHECVIDTTILYPHRMGPPKKRALKNLSAEILKKVIQELETGHDSAEDAQIAVELVLAKLKADNVK